MPSLGKCALKFDRFHKNSLMNYNESNTADTTLANTKIAPSYLVEQRNEDPYITQTIWNHESDR